MWDSVAYSELALFEVPSFTQCLAKISTLCEQNGAHSVVDPLFVSAWGCLRKASEQQVLPKEVLQHTSSEIVNK